MLSSRNLIRNSGAALKSGNRITDWEFLPGNEGRLSQVQVPEFSRDCIPQSAHAFELSSGAGECGVLQQELKINEVTSHHFAFRFAARSCLEQPTCEVNIKTLAEGGPQRSLHSYVVHLSSGWERYRTAFNVPEADLSKPLLVEIRVKAESEMIRVWITDFRLVSVTEDEPRFSVRFTTRGNVNLPSSRLRAYLVEDYLHLLGWQTSINEGSDFDILVCQKVRCWASWLVARLRKRSIIFDLDDNEPAQSLFRALSIFVFSNIVDGISTGGEVLASMMSKWNSKCYLFDNMIDVLNGDIVRPDRKYRNKLIWFGMPENAWELDKLALSKPVTKITRDGDIEYQVKTVDMQLIEHDLALFPVTLSPHSKAKNANRMIKAVGLGLPFLASDTPEHRRALAHLDLPETFLVREGEEWSERIADMGRDYNACLSQIMTARQTAFDVYGVERIVSDWIDFCTDVMSDRGQ